YIDDVNQDPVVIVDGLTKAGSFLDGGANHPLQLAAIPLLEPSRVEQEKLALQRHFKMKRDHVLKRLEQLGLKVKCPPKATFYIWLDLEDLPAPLNNGLTFFEELLKEKTIVIPGIFFDINPAHRRNLFNSSCHHFVRLSFGPPLKDLDMGLAAIERIVRKAKREGMHVFGHNYKQSAKKSIHLERMV
ncbi:pyridoxal phosphate-dependent transferase, partial [Sparassis latifolia]